jgi:ElaB/YqjD/DUF883 family membrane-anchored ribosome-binding protein
MQTISSQDQLNRIENELQHVKELLELLVGKIAQQERKEVDEIPNARTRAVLKQAEEDLKIGNTSPKFASAEEAIKWLHQQVENESTI